ncbi:MAG: DNA gyrase inhibitor YacG [Phycisphaerae bacterium]
MARSYGNDFRNLSELEPFRMTRGRNERCRYCGRALAPDAPAHRRHWPFCCERCRMAELGHWFEERYVVSRRADQVADDAARAPAPRGGPNGASADGSGDAAPPDGPNENNT